MNCKEKSMFLLIKKLILKKINSFDDLIKEKQKFCAKYKIDPPSNVDILSFYQKLKKNKKIKNNEFLEKILKKRPIRSLSGVAVVAVLTKPWPCPGHCLYCPLEKGIPKSYLSGEPAVERAKTLKYNPFLQVKKRIEMLKRGGHPVDKIELIVIGGTWSYLPPKYQTWFIKKCFDAANGLISKNLETAQKINEKAKHRIIGLTLETRPDYITLKEIKRMRKLGCTRVELGVQIIDDKILKKNKRGHGIEEIIAATKLLKNAGFKICYHLMPGLYGSSLQNDFKKFKKVFTNSNFHPDMLKIYPCVVTKGSFLYQLWKKEKYKPYSDQQLINLLIKIKLIVPPYTRINRLIRDIPAWQIQGGSKISNLREFVQKKMKELKKPCQCIRCREIKDLKFKISSFKLIRREYVASEGKEIFLSFENKKESKLIAFCRLRLSKNSDQIFPVLKNTALIRELHTYGQSVEVNKKNKKAIQHLGFGKKLMIEAEKIAKKQGYKKMAVISGIGVRQYYRRLGYRLKNTYLIKKLK
ncbi:MAG: tRNA uridine(34) 5-carboxymethylaminomethyl modification radical SAM/GNAT enzyme Elp3 [Patescibacteria group bacterium]|nr:tRNA uridine(34) 5-carboxymethylaminomethyl modification radical SAM/GNAT enzyme Elp3 [Patescibacteria group bacterium]MDD5172670.1 tRNA uridine(34) 5-carboxymethylaminomethyl modification radical SAM/GNAT enzyme Elp3 [Patescibacteria group bacterium]